MGAAVPVACIGVRTQIVSQNFNSCPRFAIFDAVAVSTTGIEMAAGCCVLPARRAAGRLPIEVAPYPYHRLITSTPSS
jgi:hypothetical protein